jgi:peptide deformylase
MSKILKIITNPNPILRKQSSPVDTNNINSTELLELYDDMTATMLKKDGVGLAAPQIAKNIRLVVIHHKGKTRMMINPVITKKSWAKKISEEGCLSLPNIFGDVSRHKKISCNYTDLKGKKQKLIAENMLARIIQHEIDHLDGILFTDIAKNIKHP